MMDLEELYKEFQHSAFCDPVFAKHPLIANSSFIVTGLFVSAPIFSTITTQWLLFLGGKSAWNIRKTWFLHVLSLNEPHRFFALPMSRPLILRYGAPSRSCTGREWPGNWWIGHDLIKFKEKNQPGPSNFKANKYPKTTGRMKIQECKFGELWSCVLSVEKDMDTRLGRAPAQREYPQGAVSLVDPPKSQSLWTIQKKKITTYLTPPDRTSVISGSSPLFLIRSHLLLVKSRFLDDMSIHGW